MLSWSAHETQQAVELDAIVDPDTDPLLPGGRALITLARAVSNPRPERTAVQAVAYELGVETAVDAAAVAANFQIMNRVVDATGLPIGRRRRQEGAELIARLGLDRFPHAMQ